MLDVNGKKKYHKMIRLAFSDNWNGVTDKMPTLNAVYDVIVNVQEDINALKYCLNYEGNWDASSGNAPGHRTKDVDGSISESYPSRFTDANADFPIAGVSVGDRLWIKEGDDTGIYMISAVYTTYVECSGESFGTASGLGYEIFDASDGDYWNVTTEGTWDSRAWKLLDWIIWELGSKKWYRVKFFRSAPTISVAAGDSVQDAVD